MGTRLRLRLHRCVGAAAGWDCNSLNNSVNLTWNPPGKAFSIDDPINGCHVPTAGIAARSGPASARKLLVNFALCSDVLSSTPPGSGENLDEMHAFGENPAGF